MIRDGLILQADFNGTEPGEVWAVDDTATPSTTTIWQFADPQGTARTLARMDASGNWLVQQRMFDADGELVDRLGATSDTVLTALPATWNGQHQDRTTGLYGNGVLVYDALAGRYINQAAAATDANPYRYDNGDPVNDGYSNSLMRFFGEGFRATLGDTYLAQATDAEINSLAIGSAIVGGLSGGWAASGLGLTGLSAWVVGGAVGGVAEYTTLTAGAMAFDRLDNDGIITGVGPTWQGAASAGTFGAIGGGVVFGIGSAGSSIGRVLKVPQAASWLATSWRGAFGPQKSGIAASLWSSRPPGIQVRRIGSYWVKRVDPEASPLMQAWGRESIRAQEHALAMLHKAGSPAANFKRLKNGTLAVEHVGPTMGSSSFLDRNYWSAVWRDTRVIGLPNDLKPHNYGAGYRAFDPALDRVTLGIAGVGGIGTAGATLYTLHHSGLVNFGFRE